MERILLSLLKMKCERALSTFLWPPIANLFSPLPLLFHCSARLS
jgi:hypothetical protein